MTKRPVVSFDELMARPPIPGHHAEGPPVERVDPPKTARFGNTERGIPWQPAPPDDPHNYLRAPLPTATAPEPAAPPRTPDPWCDQ